MLCELAWVLESAYAYTTRDIASVLEQMLMTAKFEIQGRDTAWRALCDYRSSSADFADYFIGHENRRMGCEVTVTFD